jgi:hypothetical protein
VYRETEKHNYKYTFLACYRTFCTSGVICENFVQQPIKLADGKCAEYGRPLKVHKLTFVRIVDRQQACLASTQQWAMLHVFHNVSHEVPIILLRDRN